MTINTVILLILSGFAAVALSYFQYFFKAKSKSKANLLLAFLRSIAIFCILALLINPSVIKKSYQVEKPALIVAVDNSSSINMLSSKSEAEATLNKILENSDLAKKFEIKQYQFDRDLNILDSLNFQGKQTNISQIGTQLSKVYRNSSIVTLLLTDGNQTEGSDYIYSFGNRNKVLPIILGDTTSVFDLKIDRINANKYAYHKNKFPVEIFVNYNGNKRVEAKVSISRDSKVISTQQISLSNSKNVEIVNFLLPADKIGLNNYKATVTSAETEKNTYNNSKDFLVDVIDQKSEIAIISDINHPDIAAIKRSILNNAQRNVAIISPKNFQSAADYNLLILYQPNANFKDIMNLAKARKQNYLVIAGNSSDYNFLNSLQTDLAFKVSNQVEEYLPAVNSSFNLFNTKDLKTDYFPPLQMPYGKITTSNNVTVLLDSKINNLSTGSPMLAFSDIDGQRVGYLLGEGIWKWRLKSHDATKSFEEFDNFFDKTIQYLMSDNSRKSLVVTHENFYNSSDDIIISAQYFDKNYQPDPDAKLTMSLQDSKTGKIKLLDFLKNDTDFQVNLNGLSAGNYKLIVKEKNSNATYTSKIEIIEFDIEKQFVNPDYQKLKQLADATSGSIFLSSQVDEALDQLLNDKNFQSIEKESTKKGSLIDWIWLLIIAAFCLSAEWLLRKYYGML
ncbi:hypothetical protein [Flavobacterium ardleyense]|uniref:hypothetical protein n=1 Tax=Flavobacterium ardleyense TaxID=2038737 RepID=UPI00298D555B|nr:hypothetical protein [Flavobacterium ardleyense]